MLVDLLRRRCVRSVVWFHTDHWEPWGQGISPESLRRVAVFADQASSSPFARRMTLFYLTGTQYRLRADATSRASASREIIELAPRTEQQHEQARRALAEIHSGTEIEFQFHLHHEHLVGNEGDWGDLHRAVRPLTNPELDKARMHFLLQTELEVHRRHTGSPMRSWAFVHGMWALNASDSRICGIENEIELLMAHGCWGDFTFPAGRRHCDPTIHEAPYTCKPLSAAKAYDDPRCSPLPLGRGASALTPGRFLIWNSRAKHAVCSLDCYTEEDAARLDNTVHIVSTWLSDCPVIDDTLYIKTHAHSMDGRYYAEGHKMPLTSSRVSALFDLLRRSCDGAGVELHVKTVNEVLNALRQSDKASPALSGRQGETMTSAIAATERPIDFDAANQIAVAAVKTWTVQQPRYAASLGDYYRVRLNQNNLLIEAERQIVDYCRHQFDPACLFYELGCGYGELSLMLAIAGFSATAFESEEGRFKGAMALREALAQSGYDTTRASFIHGRFPDALQLAQLQSPSSPILVATNVTSKYIVQNFDFVTRALRLFDHLVLDLARFGDVRDKASQSSLQETLNELGFTEVTAVFTAGANNIRHFRRATSIGRSEGSSFDPFREFAGSFKMGGTLTVSSCPVCDGASISPLWLLPQSRLSARTHLNAPGAPYHNTYLDYLPLLQTPQHIFKFDICRDCHTVFRNPKDEDWKVYRDDTSKVTAFKEKGLAPFADTARSYAAQFPPNTRVVVDAACGSGQILAIFRESYPQLQLFGLELSEPSIDWMKSIGLSGAVIDLDLDDLDNHVEPGTVDFIVFNEAFEHVRAPLLVLKKLFRMLRPGGRIHFTAQYYGPENSLQVRVGEPIYIDRHGLNWIIEQLGAKLLDLKADIKFRVTLEKTDG